MALVVYSGVCGGGRGVGVGLCDARPGVTQALTQHSNALTSSPWHSHTARLSKEFWAFLKVLSLTLVTVRPFLLLNLSSPRHSHLARLSQEEFWAFPAVPLLAPVAAWPFLWAANAKTAKSKIYSSRFWPLEIPDVKYGGVLKYTWLSVAIFCYYLLFLFLCCYVLLDTLLCYSSYVWVRPGVTMTFYTIRDSIGTLQEVIQHAKQCPYLCTRGEFKYASSVMRILIN